MPDHIHVLLDVEPQFGVHKAIKRFKGVSSRYLRQEFPHLKSRLPTLWTNSYFVSTVGGAPLEVVKQYIQLQQSCLKATLVACGESSAVGGERGAEGGFPSVGNPRSRWGLPP